MCVVRALWLDPLVLFVGSESSCIRQAAKDRASVRENNNDPDLLDVHVVLMHSALYDAATLNATGNIIDWIRNLKLKDAMISVASACAGGAIMYFILDRVPGV